MTPLPPLEELPCPEILTPISFPPVISNPGLASNYFVEEEILISQVALEFPKDRAKVHFRRHIRLTHGKFITENAC